MSKPNAMRLLIISGLSGAGKTVALHMLEDLGYYCMDNMPLGLLDAFVAETGKHPNPHYEWVAVGVDARSLPDDLRGMPELVRRLRDSDVRCEIIFLRADEEVLFKRYSETRRKHPLSDDNLSLKEAIEREMDVLSPVAEQADLVIDTSRTSLHELRDLIRRRVHREDTDTLSILVQSFGFKHGVPADADFVFDLRCLPNPHWEPELRSHSGRENVVAQYLEGFETVRRMLRDIRTFLDTWIPQFEASNRSYITIACGCTGGQHRSVYFAEQLAAHFRERHEHVVVRHNELAGETLD